MKVYILTSKDAIKTTDKDQNVTYLFIDENNEYFGTFYLGGQYRGALKYTHSTDTEGKDQLILSNIGGDRSINLLSARDIASKLPGGATSANRTYAQCVQQLTAWVFYNILTGPPPYNTIFHAYFYSVIAVNGIVIYCVGEVAYCAIFGC